ncbi:MAG: GMC family oxidoreductase [Pseudomonadota bacterium]
MSNYLIDSRTLPDGHEVNADICVIGAGAAGLTVVRELIASGLTVAVFEAGALNPRAVDRDLLECEIAGHPYPIDETRLRYFGGTANHWGGQCVPLDSHDFERLSYVPYSGWPYGLETLAPYYRRATEHLRLGGDRFDADAVAREVGAELIDFSGTSVRNVLARYNRFRFGLELTDRFEELDDVSVYYCADLIDLTLQDDSSLITSASFRTTAGNTVTATARKFILATGGIETARLLLSINRQRPAGLGNGNDLVGRFWQDHPWVYSGTMVFWDEIPPTDLYFSTIQRGEHGVRVHIALTPEAEIENEIPAFRAEVRSSSEASILKHQLASGDIGVRDIGRFLARIDDLGASELCNAPQDVASFDLANYFQMKPDPENRVRLGEQRDMFDRPLPALDFRFGMEAAETIGRAHRLIADDMLRRGLGRFRIETDEEALGDPGRHHWGAHHMGTTRMSVNPNEGVADADARVHETDNLYIAGSALFPTCGWQNPTLTIVATAMKLADHLKLQFRAEGAL